MKDEAKGRKSKDKETLDPASISTDQFALVHGKKKLGCQMLKNTERRFPSSINPQNSIVLSIENDTMYINQENKRKDQLSIEPVKKSSQYQKRYRRTQYKNLYLHPLPHYCTTAT